MPKTPKTHYLKILSNHFRDIVDGLKTYEIRKDDRNFQPGDYLILHSHTRMSYPDDDEIFLAPTDQAIRVLVTHKSTFEQKEGYCVLAIQEIEHLQRTDRGFSVHLVEC